MLGFDYSFDHSWLLLAAVFGASFLQAATGIGFGVIAGPVILIAMNDGAAIQVSILLSFAIAVMLGPGLFGAADKSLLKRLLAGTIVGAPLGILAFRATGVDGLKLAAGAAVLLMAVAATGLFNAASRKPGGGPYAEASVGLISGAMSAALAMPGPVVAAYMASQGRRKQTTRATLLVLFLFTYPIAYAFQYALGGGSSLALGMSWQLLPACVLGVVGGKLSASLIGESSFRAIIVSVLLATAAGLFFSVLG